MIWTKAQSAIVRKDIREAMSTKMVKTSMLIMPIMMAVLLPCVFTAVTYFVPNEAGDFDAAMALMPIDFGIGDTMRAVYYYLMNYFMPLFFIMIPVMASSVAAGSSFVGEKERHTLATIIYSPLSINQLFQAKVAGALLTALTITGIAFAGFACVSIVGSVLIYKSFVLDMGIWLTILLLLAPSISLVGITLMVLASAKASTFQEAQQYSAILLAPTLLLMMIPQISGMFLFNAPQLALLSLGFLLVALVLMRISSLRFTPEKLLK